MTKQLILEDDRESVRVVTLNRPEKLNAITGNFVVQLNEAIERADRDDAVRAVLIIGAGRAFCAGRDLTDIGNSGEQSRRDRLDDLTAAGRHVMTLHECAKPIVAAINGVAVGGGLSIALNSDIRVMAASAKLLTGYARRGLSPDGGMSYALPRLVGLSRATELILSGRELASSEALAIGLVAAVFPDETFREAAFAYTAAIAAGGPVGLAYSKRLLLDSLDASLDAQLRREIHYLRACMQTEDVREGVTAFMEKRPPRFEGR
jgi:2-(1,2-epoxy-1,2-dihydrophenyl)acetyl-CoA isomerase